MRSKIAVSSREPGLDPVGACVGPKGSRVRMIVSELRGERIDVVPWNDDPPTFVAQLAVAGEGLARLRRRRHAHRHRHRARRPALARHRQGGPERPPRREAHRLAHRHQERAAGRRRGHRRGARRAERPAEETDGRCCAVTATGIRCRNKARPGSAYCGVHEKEADGEVMQGPQEAGAHLPGVRSGSRQARSRARRAVVRGRRDRGPDGQGERPGRVRAPSAGVLRSGGPQAAVRPRPAGEPQGRRRGTHTTRFRAPDRPGALANGTVTRCPA